MVIIGGNYADFDEKVNSRGSFGSENVGAVNH
jgi:hypothetical protein